MADIGQDYIDFMPKLATAATNDGAQGFAAPSEGEHEFEVKEVILGHTKKGDKMMLTVQFECAEGDPDKGKPAFTTLDALTDIQRLKAIAQIVAGTMPKGGNLNPDAVGLLIQELSTLPEPVGDVPPPPPAPNQ